jgi:deoxycytidylate deaminase
MIVNIFNRYLRSAIDVMKEVDKGHLEYNLAAVLVSGGRILSIGYNKAGHRGLVEAYKHHPWANIHAEVDAVLQVRRKIDLTGSKIYVARSRDDGSVGHARPCDMCQAILKAYGIKRAYYTIDETSYGVMTP